MRSIMPEEVKKEIALIESLCCIRIGFGSGRDGVRDRKEKNA